jgi:hypothetical protein
MLISEVVSKLFQKSDVMSCQKSEEHFAIKKPMTVATAVSENPFE